LVVPLFVVPLFSLPQRTHSLKPPNTSPPPLLPTRSLCFTGHPPHTQWVFFFTPFYQGFFSPAAPLPTGDPSPPPNSILPHSVSPPNPLPPFGHVQTSCQAPTPSVPISRTEVYRQPPTLLLPPSIPKRRPPLDGLDSEFMALVLSLFLTCRTQFIWLNPFFLIFFLFFRLFFTPVPPHIVRALPSTSLLRFWSSQNRFSSSSPLYPSTKLGPPPKHVRIPPYMEFQELLTTCLWQPLSKFFLLTGFTQSPSGFSSSLFFYL